MSQNFQNEKNLNIDFYWRLIKNQLVQSQMIIFSAIVFLPLVFILYFLIKNGWATLSWNFFSKTPQPIGTTGGGMVHAILGTIILTLTSGLMAIPWGIGLGIFLAETKETLLKKMVRSFIDIMNSTPSIVIGIFVYTIFVKPFKSFSALSGAIALGLIILPIVAKIVEEILKLVPKDVRYSALALGIEPWKVTLKIIVWGARQNILPGILLAIARSAGETAPLLFTAFGSLYISYSLTQPIASLPVEIYNYAISPYQEWHNLAWAGSLTLILIILSLNLTTKWMIKRSQQ